MSFVYCYHLFLGSLLSAGTAHTAAPADTLRLLTRPTCDVSPPTRRWRGTIGQQAVTLTLDSGRWGYSGSYYYNHRGQELRLSQEKSVSPASLTLAESVEGKTTGYFMFNRPVGPHLSGTWCSPDNRRKLPFLLHETYADAAQYQSEYWQLTTYLPTAADPDPARGTTLLSQEYLRVSLPQRPAVEQQLRQALAPPVSKSLMASYLDTLLARRQAVVPDYYYSGYKLVVYNSNYLLSVIELDSFKASPQEEDSTGIASHEWHQGSTFDLHTGRRLQLADLLVPGYQARLRQLVLKKLRAAWQDRPQYGEIGQNGKLPVGGFYVTPAGLCFPYDDRSDDSLAFPGPYHADRDFTIELSYAALLPLINQNGPLAPLLQEHHLLPKQP